MKRSAVPSRALRAIEDAGGSLFAWRDQEFLTLLDPSGALTRLSRTAGLVGSTLAAVVAIASLWQVAGLGAAAAAAAALLLGAFFPRLPCWPLAVAASAIGTGDVVAAFLGAAALIIVQVGSGRPAAGKLGTAAWSILALGSNPMLASSIAVGGAVAVCVAGVILGGSPIGPLRSKQIAVKLPAPAPKLPWLVSLMKRKAIASPPPEIKRKSAGGFGERMTALILLGLPRFQGTTIAHDVALPGSDRANVDHLVITKRAAFALDSKVLRGQLVFEGGEALAVTAHGKENLTRLVESIARQAGAVAEVLGVEVKPALVIHEASVGHITEIAVAAGTIVTVVPAAGLLSWVTTAATEQTHERAQLAIENLRGLQSNVGGSLRPVQPFGLVDGRAVRSMTMPVQTVSMVRPPRIPAAVAPRPDVATPSTPVVSAADRAWSQMRQLPRLAPEQLDEPGLSAIQPGSVLSIVGTRDGQLVDATWVAVSPVVAGPEPGSQVVHATTPELWAQHLASGEPVWFTPAPADRVFFTPEGL